MSTGHDSAPAGRSASRIPAIRSRREGSRSPLPIYHRPLPPEANVRRWSLRSLATACEGVQGSSAVLSTCGEIRSTGAGSSSGSPLHLGVGGHDPPLREQPGPHRRVGAVDHARAVIALGSSTASTTRQPDIGEYGPGDVAQLQPGSRCLNSFQACTPDAHRATETPLRSCYWARQTELLGHRQRRHPVWRSLARNRSIIRTNRQHPNSAGPGDPLKRDEAYVTSRHPPQLTWPRQAASTTSGSSSRCAVAPSLAAVDATVASHHGEVGGPSGHHEGRVVSRHPPSCRVAPVTHVIAGRPSAAR